MRMLLLLAGGTMASPKRRPIRPFIATGSVPALRPPWLFGYDTPSQGMLVRIPSEGTGAQGTLVRISGPAVPRYSEGAPVVVQVISA
jgi:hypothetical protein